MIERLQDWLAERFIEWHTDHPLGFHGEGRKCGYLAGGCGYWRTKWWVPDWLWRLVQ